MRQDRLAIGQAAQQLGIEPHVLRHWELVGVLTPTRAGSGHRRSSEDDLDAARLIRRLQRVGLSLSEIRTLTTANRTDREHVVARRLEDLNASLQATRQAINFLEHTRQCTHRTIALCPECEDFARP